MDQDDEKKKNNGKSSLKKSLFLNIFIPISLILFILVVVISTGIILNENKKLNLFLVNETILIANLTENFRLYEIINLNRSINKNASILFRDPITKFELHFTRPSPFPLNQFDNIFLENKNGFFLYGKYKIFFAESFLSRVCVVIVPRMIYHSIAIKTIIHALLIYLIINLILYFLIIKVEKILTIDLTSQYIHIKYLIEGKYNNNEVISKISEIDNIRYGLNNLITILKERREFYSSLILFQKKVLDLIPVGVIIFNEKGLFEDANTFGYAQIEREVKKNNIDLTDLNSILVEKFSIDSIIANESLNFLNQNNVVELKLKPSITISKRVFGKIVGDKKIILLVPLNFSTEEEKDDNTLILNQTLAPFISDFAHELRSPLNSILGFSQIIKDGVEGDNLEEIKNDGKIINESGQIMMTFIDDIIFLSRLGLKKIESLYVSFDLTLLFTLMNYYFKGIFKNKDTIFVLPQNIENKEIISDFQNIRRILLLFLFYLRSLFPLPIKIEMNFESMENDFYSINIFYFFDKENIISQRNSKIIFDFCNQISKDSSLEIYNEIKGKSGIFKLKFNSKI